MNNEPIEKQDKLILLSLSAIPIMQYIADVIQGFDFLMWARLADDAFYYFEICKHLPYFNDGIKTSGFHPLFMFLIMPFHFFFDREMAIVLSLLILVLAHCTSVWLVWCYVFNLFSKQSAFCAAAIWAISGQLYTITMSGLEAILSVALSLCTILTLPKHAINNTKSKPFLLFAALFAISFLARMDAPLILLPYAGVVGFALIKQGRFKLATLVALIPIGTLVVWLLCIKSWTGELFPTSASAEKVLWGVGTQFQVTDLEYLKHTFYMVAVRTFGFLFPIWSFKYILLAIVITLLLGGVGVYSMTCLNNPDVWRQKALAVLALIFGYAIWLSYYIFHHGSLRYWYYAYIALAFICGVLPFVVVGVEHLLNGKKISWLITTTFVLLVFLFNRPQPFFPAEFDKYKSGVVLDQFLDTLEPGSKIGSFNTGIYNFFSSHDIINLDGLVNPKARDAIKDGTMDQYLVQNKIRYLLETDVLRTTSVHHLFRSGNVRVEKIIDLSEHYRPYRDNYEKKVYLYKIIMD